MLVLMAGQVETVMKTSMSAIIIQVPVSMAAARYIF